MIQFDFDNQCCGCAACANACPVDAIQMRQNDEGFWFPWVDERVCINCKKCEKVCPHLNAAKEPSSFSPKDFSDKQAYLFFSKGEERLHSTSGGFMYEVAKKTIAEGGLVCGCVWNESMEAVHAVTDDEGLLNRFQGSKYVQSYMGDCFKKIKTALLNGRKVFFGGTPCQTAALNRFLGNVSRENLVSVCVICHGVPSPLVWKKYISCLEKKYRAKLVGVNMRDKSYKGYSESYARYDLKKDNGDIFSIGQSSYLSDPFIFLFTDNLFLRRSCNHCYYKATECFADIVAGDFHASVEEAGKWGCSGLIAMTPKGVSVVESTEGFKEKVDISIVRDVNHMLWKSAPEHKKRKLFFDKMKKMQDEDMSLFTNFLPVRFKIKKAMNQIGVFKCWKSLKRKIHREH